MLYNNSNGKQYEVIKLDTLRNKAILKPLKPTWDDFPYMIAKGFSMNSTSWDAGTYDLSLEQAEELF